MRIPHQGGGFSASPVASDGKICGEDMSFMRGSLMTILLVGLGWPNNPSASGQKIADIVSINGQFRLDDAENFDFKRLSVFTNHRPGKDRAWVEDGSFIPDENGR